MFLICQNFAITPIVQSMRLKMSMYKIENKIWRKSTFCWSPVYFLSHKRLIEVSFNLNQWFYISISHQRHFKPMCHSYVSFSESFVLNKCQTNHMKFEYFFYWFHWGNLNYSAQIRFPMISILWHTWAFEIQDEIGEIGVNGNYIRLSCALDETGFVKVRLVAKPMMKFMVVLLVILNNLQKRVPTRVQ